MADPEDALRPSDVVGERIRELRRLRGWTAKQLAEQCVNEGVVEMTAPAILNIETGRRGPDGKRRRDVTIDELLALATVLSVAPDSLMFPLSGPGQTAVPAPIEVTPKRHVSDRVLLRRWAAGMEPLSPDEDFWAYVDDANPAAAARVDEDQLRAIIDSAVKVELRKHVSDIKEFAGMFVSLATRMAPPGADTDKALAETQKLLADYGLSTEDLIARSSVFPERRETEQGSDSSSSETPSGEGPR